MLKNSNQTLPEQTVKKQAGGLVSVNTNHTLHELINPDKGLFACLGTKYNDDFFGRDSLVAARELLDWKPQIAREVILRLATLQGTKSDDKTDEEPGRIIHESRSFDTLKNKPVNNIIGKYFSQLWGSERGVMNTYFSIDSTPLYISLVADLAKKDPSILKEKITRNNGSEITIKRSLIEAANWVTGHIGSNGLVEVKRRNPIGLLHQTWKDSPTGYIHADGKMANIFKPIAYLNVQLLSIDALTATVKILGASDIEAGQKLAETARLLRKNTLEKFWLKKEKFFAAAIDKDHFGNHRQLRTLQSDAFWTLDSTLFDELAENEREKYLTPIIGKMFSKEFLTDAGIRCRAMKHRDIESAGYHGSYAVWLNDTEIAAKGLRRQGFERLADQLEARVLNSINYSGRHYDFFYVMDDGKIVINPESAAKYKQAEVLPVQIIPQTDTAWTVAAVFTAKLHGNRVKAETKKWQSQLEDQIFFGIKNVKVYLTVEELSKNLPTRTDVYLDIKKGNHEIAKNLSAQIASNYYQGLKHKVKQSSGDLVDSARLFSLKHTGLKTLKRQPKA